MKKRKVKRTAPLKGQKFGPMMGRGCGLHVLPFTLPFTLNDEMDDVSNWAKDAAKKLMEEK